MSSALQSSSLGIPSIVEGEVAVESSLTSLRREQTGEDVIEMALERLCLDVLEGENDSVWYCIWKDGEGVYLGEKVALVLETDDVDDGRVCENWCSSSQREGVNDDVREQVEDLLELEGN